ncbi:MAG: class I SAM-dependent methyltransferase [Simkaniaceae bacterium]|nr:class I SAM-dependent methyltransferase [Candidatus Sacchlamyda saccharinae]
MEAKRRHSHIALAHSYWQNHVQKDTWAIDATCGNGKDTSFLAQICTGVISIDIQEKALESARQEAGENVSFFCQSHEEFPSQAYEKPISLIVYNLGYLPGGDKGLTTLTSSTLKSLNRAMEILLPGGLISITCYPGHPEGANEEEALLTFAKGLDPKNWSACHHRWLNRNKAPSLLLLEKSFVK